MTAKKFLIYQLVLAIILTGVVLASVVIGNYVVPLIAIITAILLMLLMKKKVKEVLEDERDFEIGGKAARYAISIYAGISGIAVIILSALRNHNPSFEIVGSVLAYSICSLLILHIIIYKILEKKGSK